MWTFGGRVLGSCRLVIMRWCAIAQWFGACACRYIGPAVIHGSKHRSVGAGGSLVLRLLRGHRGMVLLSGGKFCCSRPCLHTVRPAVKADTIDGPVGIDHISRVSVMNDRGVHVRDTRIVEIPAASPVTAIESRAGITESVVNASVEADDWTPVTRVPGIGAIYETPVARSPKQTGFGWKNPNARYPVIAGVAISPIARLPDVTGARAERLAVDRQKRGTDPDGNADGDLGCRAAIGWSRKS
jgi:hypothetical protein